MSAVPRATAPCPSAATTRYGCRRDCHALQTIVSREISPYEPAVITVGELHGGTARNVIAGTAYLAGTVRTYGDSTHEEMPELMRRIVEHTAAALGAEAELTDYTIANYKSKTTRPRASAAVRP